MRYPLAKWIGSPNFGYPQGAHGGLSPIAIVDHIAAGTLSGIDGWFNNPDSEASSHLAVGKKGEVHQYVDLLDASWANGWDFTKPLPNPDLSILWLSGCAAGKINPTLRTITVEHEGQTGEAWTPEMYASDLELHRWLVSTFHIPVDDEHIIGHYRIDSVNRSNCPGTGWPRERLFNDLRRKEEKEMVVVLSCPTYLGHSPASPYAGRWIMVGAKKQSLPNAALAAYVRAKQVILVDSLTPKQIDEIPNL